MTPASCKTEHNCYDDEGGEHHAENVDAEAVGAGEFGIEGDQFELFPEESENDERDCADDGDEADVALDDGGGLAEDEGVEAGLAGVGSRLDVDEEGDAGGEPGGQDDAHGGVLFDTGCVGDEADEKDAEPTGYAGADEQETQVAAGEQEGEGDARQGGVGEGVTEQALAAEDGETAEDAADDAKQGATEGNGAQGVVVFDLEEDLAERYEQGCYERDGADQEPDTPVGTAVFSSQFLVFSHSTWWDPRLSFGLRIGKKHLLCPLRAEKKTLFYPRRATKKTFFHEGPLRATKKTFFHDGPLRTAKKILFPRWATKGHEENPFPRWATKGHDENLLSTKGH